MLTSKFKIAVELFKRGDFSAMGLTPKQEEALSFLHPSEKQTEMVLYGGAAGGGKSFKGATWLLFMGFAYEGTRYFIARDQLKQIMLSTYVTFKSVCNLWGLEYGVDYRLDGKYNIIYLSNGSEICLIDVAFKPRDPEFHDLGSTEYTCGFFEEAGGIHREAVKYLNLRVGRCKNKEYGIIGKVLLSANPTKNWLYRYFYKPWVSKVLKKNLKYIKALVTDNPHVDPSYVEKLRNEEDKSKRERLFFGNWDYDDDPTRLISDDAITNLFSNSHVERGEAHITADLAFQGSDKYILFYWEGFVLSNIKIVDKSNGKEVLDILREYKNRYKAKATNLIFDADGVGQGLTGHISGSVEFHANATPEDPSYKNMKTQCAYKLAELIEKGDIWIDCEIEEHEKDLLVQDLENLRNWKADEDGKLQIIPKKEWKKEMSGRSPDFFDNFNMRMLPILDNGVIESSDELDSLFSI